MERSLIDVCIIGCGTLAASRVEEIAVQAEFSVKAVVDPDQAAARSLAVSFRDRGHNPAVLSEIKSPEDYGLAVVQTPNGLHRECAEPFIAAGVAVVVEKPLAIKWDDIHWFAEQERRGAWICGAYNSRFAPEVRKVYEASRGQKIVSLSSVKYRHRGSDYYADGWHGTMAYDGGVLAQQAIHCIDLVCWMAGAAPRRVAALGFNRRHRIECEDTGTALIDFGEFAATVTGTTAAGRDGMAAIDILTTGGIYGDQAWGWDDGATNLWRKINLALRTKAASPVPVASVVPSLEVLHAAYVSIARHGEWVALGEPFRRLGVLA
jgi:UDP-N-acetyl-2-amino-2-deoxyglucuronate dehydrogenase